MAGRGREELNAQELLKLANLCQYRANLLTGQALVNLEAQALRDDWVRLTWKLEAMHERAKGRR